MAHRNADGQVTRDGPYEANRIRRLFAQPNASAAATILPTDTDSWTSTDGWIEPQSLTPGVWSFRGPQNVGGRTRSLLIHPTTPSTLYAGAVSGGVWKSTNAGVTWQPLTDFMSNIAVSSMAFDGANPSIIYAGTGEMSFEGIQGAGVFRSSDDGGTWSRLSTTANWTFVNRLANVPGQSGTIFAAGSFGIHRSTNSGSSWTQVAPGDYGMTVVVDPNNTSNVMAVNQNFNPFTGSWFYQVLYSTNGGASFTAATHPAVNDYRSGIQLAYAKSTSNVVYAHVGLYNGSGTSGEVWRSTDSGQSFARVSPTNVTSCRTEICALWVDPTDANFVMLGSTDLAKSTNGGTTVTTLGIGYIMTDDVHPDLHAIIAHPQYNGSTNRTVYICTDGGIFRTDNIATAGFGTGSWTSLNTGYQTAQYYAASGTPTGVGRFYGGTQDNGTLYTSQIAEPPRLPTYAGLLFGGDGGFVAIDRVNPNNVYGEYTFLQLFRSMDGGATASYISAPPDAGNSATAAFISPFMLDPNVSTRLIAAGKSLWRTQDATATSPSWTQIRSAAPGVISAISIAPMNSDVIWIGEADLTPPFQDGTIAKTTNGTAASPTWSTVHVSGGGGSLPDRVPTSILIDPDDENTVYITYGGYVYDNIWRTTNGGTTWTAVTSVSTLGWPPTPVRAIARHPRNPNVLYVGTEVGMYETDNGGSTWTTSQTGPNDAPVYDLTFIPGTDLLLAATYGRGLWTADTSSVPTYAPTNLLATASGTSVVNVSWTAYPGATGYELVRSAGGAAYTTIAVGGTTYPDTAVTAGVTYLYRVRAVLGGGVKTGLSNIDLATTTIFTNDGSLAGQIIEATHLQEMRSAVNAVLTAAHLPTITFGSVTPGVTPITLTDITALRDSLIRAYRSIGKPDPTYSENLTTNTVVKAVHFQEVRNLAK